MISPKDHDDNLPDEPSVLSGFCRLQPIRIYCQAGHAPTHPILSALPSISVIGPYDIVFAEVLPVLNLDDFQ